VARSWRKGHNEELRNFYVSANVIRVIKSRRMTGTGHVARMGEMGNAYSILVARPVGRYGRRGEDNIRMDLKEIGFESVNWIHVAQNRDQWWTLVSTVMNLRVL
jgi:hypothetical protein